MPIGIKTGKNPTLRAFPEKKGNQSEAWLELKRRALKPTELKFNLFCQEMCKTPVERKKAKILTFALSGKDVLNLPSCGTLNPTMQHWS